MKKILIVDDTIENLEAAKKFFSQNKEYEFLYATNRSEAEKLLPECDALITDIQMPFNNESKEVSGLNGKLLEIEAYHMEKPAISLSQHGDGLIWKSPTFDTTKINGASHYKRWATILVEKFIGKEFSKEEENGDMGVLLDGLPNDKLKSIIGIDTRRSLNKTDSSAWEFGLKVISERLQMMDEKTKELKSKNTPADENSMGFKLK